MIEINKIYKTEQNIITDLNLQGVKEINVIYGKLGIRIVDNKNSYHWTFDFVKEGFYLAYKGKLSKFKKLHNLYNKI